jgi:glycosyltransferase involved in cell wall biosynthesis
MQTLLSINNYHYVRGGAEFVFLEHNKLFADTGWNVVPFSMQHEKNLPSKYSDYFVDEIELGANYGFVEKLAKSAKAIYSTEAKSNIAALIDHVRPDIAHGHNIYHHLSPAILPVLKKAGIPVVLTLHDLKIACPAYKMMTHDGVCERCKGGAIHNVVLHKCLHGNRLLSAWAAAEAALHGILRTYAKNVDRFIVPSRFYQTKLVEWGWPAEKFRYVPNFVNAVEIRPQFEPGDNFAYFGRLSNEKGLGTLIEAASIAGVALQIIGTGPERERLESLAADLGVQVEFPGFVSGDALFDRLRSSRAVVLPSEWYENAPISVLEAYACGKPVIGANIGGIPELIDDDRGRVFEAFSVQDLAATLTSFSRANDAELADMGRCGRQYVERVHSEAAYLDSCSVIYKELTG